MVQTHADIALTDDWQLAATAVSYAIMQPTDTMKFRVDTAAPAESADGVTLCKDDCQPWQYDFAASTVNLYVKGRGRVRILYSA